MLSHSKHATKVLIGLGAIPASYKTKGSSSTGASSSHAWHDLGALVAHQLLRTAEVPTNDFHDPAREHSNGRNRDESGRNRKDRDFITKGNKGRRAIVTAKKHRISWDTAAFAHMGGLWCDRLLLGEPPERAAVLHPYTEIAHSGEAVASVLQSHSHLAPKDLLVMAADESLPVGAVALKHVGMSELLLPRVGGKRSMIDEGLGSIHEAVLQSRGHLPSMADGQLRLPVVCVGAGGTPFGLAGAIEEQAMEGLKKDALPRAAFSAALWCSCPDRVVPYLDKKLPANLTLWRRIQQGMPSVRDEAILRAKSEGRRLGGMFEGRQETVTMQVIERMQAKRKRL